MFVWFSCCGACGVVGLMRLVFAVVWILRFGGVGVACGFLFCVICGFD